MRNQEIEVREVAPIAVSVPQAAKMLGIKRWRAYDLINQGVIPSIRLGERCIVVPVAGLERWALQEAGMLDQEGGRTA